MKLSNRLIYFFTSLFTYVILCLIEYYVLSNLLDIISTSFKVHLIAMIICLLLVNPLITYLVINTLPIKPDLKLKGNIKEDLARHD